MKTRALKENRSLHVWGAEQRESQNLPWSAPWHYYSSSRVDQELRGRPREVPSVYNGEAHWYLRRNHGNDRCGLETPMGFGMGPEPV